MIAEYNTHMDTLHYIKWFLWAAVMFGLLYAVQAPFRKTNRNLLKLLVWFIKLIIMIAQKRCGRSLMILQMRK